MTPQKLLFCLALGGMAGILAAGLPPNPEIPLNQATEAARLNNLGAAYMNQQLFEKALKNFQDAAKLDANLEIVRVNEGIALLNMGRVDSARPLLEEAVKADRAMRMPGTTWVSSRRAPARRRPQSKPSGRSPPSTPAIPTPGIFWVRRTPRTNNIQRPSMPSSMRCG